MHPQASAPPQAGDRPEEAGARSSDGPSPDPALDAPRAWEEALDGEREQLFAGFSGRMEPQVVVAELQRWAVYQGHLVDTCASHPSSHSNPPDSLPSTHCRRQQEAETLRTELGTSQAAQAELHASLSAMALENIRLRDALAAAQRAAEPSVVQLRQVLLDPAVNAELARLKRELERRSGRGPDDPATGRVSRRGLAFGCLLRWGRICRETLDEGRQSGHGTTVHGVWGCQLCQSVCAQIACACSLLPAGW